MRALLGILLFAIPLLAGGSADAADPDALWKIVHGRCVPDQQQNGKPEPCAMVDLWGGEQRGYAILKDIVGQTQFLLIATGRLTGIEAPELLARDVPNFWQAAWDSRRFTEARAKRKLGRDEIGLAINSVHGRTQDQFHIHIDCLRQDVVAVLRARAPTIGESWAPLGGTLAGHEYRAMRVRASELGAVDPFRLLADGVPEAAAEMGEWSLAVAGARFADGDGFVLLADRADPAVGNVGSAEDLQDHACRIADAAG